VEVIDAYTAFKKNGIDFFCGVPDSLLKDFCAYIEYTTKEHIITANEGNAIALASGYYLASGKPALCYMQNSGLGNCINPLLSLCDKEVYNIPILMLIGWRGEPCVADEPQHIKQGKVTIELLDTIGVKYSVFENLHQIKFACQYMNKTKEPYALIVKRGTFSKYEYKINNHFKMSREEAISEVVKNLNDSDIIVSTTGHISRELYEYRQRLEQSHKQDFLTVGSMGHASSIALGIARLKPNRNVYCFDGDGAAIMHLGAFPVIGTQKLSKFKHIIFNNLAYESVGAQPTCANGIDFQKLALSCSYDNVFLANTKKDLQAIIKKFINCKGTSLLEIKVKCGTKENLERPKESPFENKEKFMEFLSETKTYMGINSIKNLSHIIKNEKAKKAIVFTGKKSFKEVKNIFKKQINTLKCTYYNDFSNNPQEKEVKKALSQLNGTYDIIIAIGGGSVIDFAKLFKFYAKISTSLIAIPTTIGTGTEATSFATFYINRIKQSAENNRLLPSYAIIDGQFVKSLPKYIKTCCALDAYCHAIESFWSVNSTSESIQYATKAIELLRDNIIYYINKPNIKNIENISLAANIAGKAINITKTTAAHALSYAITIKYGLPHGHAVVLSIGKLIDLNSKVTPQNCNDKRGYKFVVSQMQSLYKLLQTNNASEYFKTLFNIICLENNLSKLGITDIDSITTCVNKSRLKNNPRTLSSQELKTIFDN
jgi:phosphonopyruvate decarboxylase